MNEWYEQAKRKLEAERVSGKWEKVPFYTVNDMMPLGHGPKSAMSSATAR